MGPVSHKTIRCIGRFAAAANAGLSLIDSLITLKAQGPSRNFNASQEEKEEEDQRRCRASLAVQGVGGGGLGVRRPNPPVY